MKPLSTPCDAEIFRRAAQLLERYQEGYACNAIWTAANPRKVWLHHTTRDAHPLVVKFTAQFKRPNVNNALAWFGSYYDERNRNARILALCLMAAITERP